MSARRDLRNAEREWRAAPNHVRRTKRAVNENRVLVYFGIATAALVALSFFGLLR